MQSRRPPLADITEQIRAQVLMLQGENALTDVATVRARLEAIRQFASQGLHFIEERDWAWPQQGSPSVE